MKHFISKEAVPDEAGFREAFFDVYFNEPVAELENLAEAAKDSRQIWPNQALARLEKWSQDGLAPRVELHHIQSAEKIIPRSMIRGVLDGVRNKALNLALDLQEQSLRPAKLTDQQFKTRN